MNALTLPADQLPDRQPMFLPPSYRAGQIWTDEHGINRQTIITIDGHRDWPIVAQDERGGVWAYRANGHYIDGDKYRCYDLVRLVQDVEEKPHKLQSVYHEMVPVRHPAACSTPRS